MRILVLSIIIASGIALDVATTLYNVLLHGDRFMEANQFVQPRNLAFFLAVNVLYLLACLYPVLRTQKQSSEIFGRLRKHTFVDWVREVYRDEDPPPDSTETHETFMDFFKSADLTLPLLVLATAASLMRASAGINNLLVQFTGNGFAEVIFIALYPTVPLSVSVHLLAVFTIFLCIPLAYLIVRRVALIGSHEDDEKDEDDS